MDESSPLAMQFKELDDDNDNKLNVDQVYELLKVLGKNIYKGSVTSAAKMLNMEEESQQNKIYFTFSQFKQYFQSLGNSLKHDIWKGKYKLLGYIKQIKDQVGKKEDLSNNAAPGAKPSFPQDSGPFRGDVQITVGPTNQNYNSFIQVNIQKTQKAESKPFLKLIFEQSTNEKAKQLQAKFKKLQASVFQLIKSADPQSSQILDYIHIITNVSENKLNIFITTSNQALIELGTITAQFIDRFLGTSFEAKVDFKHQFSVDVNNFMDKTSNYTFYHALTQNYHLKLVWNALNFKQACKQIFKTIGVFQDFQYDKMDPFLLALIGIFHTELCEVNLVFDNADFQYSELQSKQQILQGLKQLNMTLQEQQNENLGVFQAIQAFQNKLYVQASIGDWRAQVNLQIKDVKQMFTKKPIQQGQQIDNQPLADPYNVSQTNNTSSNIQLSGLVKKISGSSSQKSLGKVKIQQQNDKLSECSSDD